jgi:hypothetical protein
VHIVSKNRAFVDALGDYGFTHRGLTVTDLGADAAARGLLLDVHARAAWENMGPGQIAAPELSCRAASCREKLVPN